MPQDPLPPQDFRALFGGVWLTVQASQAELESVRDSLASCSDLPPDLLDLAQLAAQTARLLRVGMERAHSVALRDALSRGLRA